MYVLYIYDQLRVHLDERLGRHCACNCRFVENNVLSIYLLADDALYAFSKLVAYLLIVVIIGQFTTWYYTAQPSCALLYVQHFGVYCFRNRPIFICIRTPRRVQVFENFLWPCAHRRCTFCYSRGSCCFPYTYITFNILPLTYCA